MKNFKKNILFFYSFIYFLTCAVPDGRAEEVIRARAIFIGDIMAHKEQIESAKKPTSEWDFTPQFRRVKPLFMSNNENKNLIVGNLETVFAGSGAGFAGYPSFNTPDSLADALVELGVDVVTLANNHILDRGLSGALRTTEVLDNAGIFWTGLRKRGEENDAFLQVEQSGLKWAFVNFSYGSNRAPVSGDISLNIISESSVIDALSQAKTSDPDIIVACFHWGNEYQYAPTKRQKDTASLALANGAALVIGTHPHVLQPVEILNDGLSTSVVAWSLGNFVSHQRTEPRERSVILAVDVEKTNKSARITRVSVAPTRVSVTKVNGKRKIEVVYAGESPRFNHAGLPKTEVAAARKAGKAVLDFLAAQETFDDEGFYTLWEEDRDTAKR
ncbi:hypothetical protein FACS1894187_05850 [Synergistales bacterium]|nr:hypothetical protein FACS1894187_05850 [Synergistales bacterium]